MKVMRTTVATVVAATLSMSAFSVFAEASLTGAGATFPAPVYAKWADTYQKETGNKVNYQDIGSSGGCKQIIANTVILVPLTRRCLTKNWLRKVCSVPDRDWRRGAGG